MMRVRTPLRGPLVVALLWLPALAGCGGELPGPPDAGSDAGSPDASGCRTSAECDDAVFCNGAERCVRSGDAPGECRPADEPACLPSQTCDEASSRCVTECASEPDADGDGHDSIDCGGDDCDDADARRFPGNTELCDLDDLDEDCDPSTYGARDGDADGFDDAACCNVTAAGARICGTDCDDTRTNVNPSSVEVCDGIDNDCNGAIDDVPVRTFCVDADGDGFGDPARAVSVGCPGEGLSALCTDCDDTRAARNPGNPEVCDLVPDNDCDPSTSPFDADGDGYDRTSCGGNDCDDTDATVHPGAPQICDRKDNTCTLGGGVLASEDFDDDGFAPIGAACAGGPLPALDCNDANPSVSPLATEVCNGIDDNCDGRVDEEPAVTEDCNRPGSIGACVSGGCTLVGCTGAHLNCDGASSNGCEADTSSSTVHCGRCDNPCASGGACTSGTCGCPSGTTLCGTAPGTCVELSTSTSHCGACGNACPSGASCEGGTCRCPFGGILCGGACVDPMVSNAHCGGCDQSCTGGSCTGGSCSCPGASGTLCSGVCRDLSVHLDHCGACDAGCRGGSCAGGVCTCPAGQSLCGGACIDTTSDAANCSGCGLSCGTGGVCTGGVCDRVVDLALGPDRTCALRSSGRVVCFGRLDVRTNVRDVVPVISSAVQVQAAINHTCARLADGRVMCWGNNFEGQLGDGTVGGGRTTPAPVVGIDDAVDLANGTEFSCVALSTGRVRCWGNGEGGRLGHGSPFDSPTPVEAIGLTAVSEVEAGYRSACAVQSGELWCWGAINSSLVPARFGTIADAVELSMPNGGGVCVRRAGGNITCVGITGSIRGDGGSGGDVVGFADAIAFSMLSSHGCAIHAGGSAECWGRNTAGQVGDGSFVDRDAPRPVSMLGAVTVIRTPPDSDSTNHTCAVQASGRVFCWGENNFGQLGTGTTLGSAVPVAVPDL